MIDIAVARLIGAMRSWQPEAPGADECDGCAASPVVALLRGIPPLPADVRHRFLLDLETIVTLEINRARVRAELEYAVVVTEFPGFDSREARARCRPEAARSASQMVARAVAAQIPDITRAVAEYLEPRYELVVVLDALALEEPPAWLPPLGARDA